MLRKILTKAKYHRIYDQVKLLVFLLLAVLAYGTIGFSVLKKVPLTNAFAITIESLEFLHTVEMDPGLRVFQTTLVIFGGVFLWFSLWTFFEFLLKGKLTKYLREVMHLVKASRTKDHVIICGGGRVGSTLARLVTAKGAKVVIIEKDPKTAQALRRQKFTVINGDASNEETLKEANLEKAKTVVAAISSGEKNVLLTLTIKQLNPNVTILARSDDAAHVKKLKSVGASQVILPEIAGAKELFGILSGKR